MNKLRITFNPDGLWDKELFRDVVKSFINDEDKFEVYIVTTSTDNTFINNVTIQSGVKVGNVYQVADNDAVVDKLDLVLADIFLSGDQRQVNLVGAHAETAVPITVNDIVDMNKTQLKYITNIQFWIKYITREQNGSKASC